MLESNYGSSVSCSRNLARLSVVGAEFDRLHSIEDLLGLMRRLRPSAFVEDLAELSCLTPSPVSTRVLVVEVEVRGSIGRH